MRAVHEVIAAQPGPLNALSRLANRAWASVASPGVRGALCLADGSLAWAPTGGHETAREVGAELAELAMRLPPNEALALPDVRSRFSTSSFAALLWSPCLAGGRLVGFAALWRGQPGDWAPAELGLAQDLADALAALLQCQLGERRARRCEERVRTASMAGSHWLWETDADGLLTWVSEGLQQHTGIDPASQLGTSARGVLIPRDDETRENWQRYLSARAAQAPFQDLIGDRDTPRGRIVVSVSGQPVFDEHGLFKGYRGASRNITQQVETQEAVRRADRQLRQALQATQERLSAVLRALPDLWFVIDAENRYIDGHLDHPQLVGEAGQLIGQTVGAMLPEAVARLQRAAVERARHTGLAQTIQYDLEVTPGATHHFEARITPMLEGQVLYLTSDITDRKVAEDKLRVSEELYRSVAATIRDGLLIVDLQGDVVAMNPAARRILGLQADVSGQALPSEGFVLLEDDLCTALPRARWPLQETIDSGQRIVDRVVPARRADHEIVWLQMSSHLLRLDPQQTPFAAMVTFRDITQERLAVQELEASEERWKFALEGAGDGVWDWDMISGVVYYSSRWKQMLGFQDPDVGDTIEEIFARIHPDDRDKVAHSTMQYMTDTPSVQEVEFRLRHRDGHFLHILSRGKVVARSADGMPSRVVGTHSDITRLKQAEDAQRAQQLAEAASAAKSEFLSRMSHEIRTPLNAITGFAQLLRLQMKASPAESTQLSYVEQILHAGRHLSGLVNDVLDLQQVEAGVLSLRPEALQLDEEVVQCLSMLLPLAEQREIAMSSHLPPGLSVIADRQRLRQVLVNIGSNAIKYNQHGGFVRVEARVLPNSVVELAIADTGAGMTPEQLTRLFQPFERLGRETSHVEGTGLGLIITRSLIESMGGRMDIDSRPGSGTRVCILLPQAPSATQAPDSPPLPPDALRHLSASTNEPHVPSTDPAPEHQRPMRVLYVEDNRINALLFAEALRPFPQLELDIAEDGDVAVNVCQNWLPDVLVLDAHLPGMSGFEVLEALRRIPGLESVPAYMCSADAMPDDIERARQAGFTGYWTKPIDIVAVTTELCGLAQRAHNAKP